MAAALTNLTVATAAYKLVFSQMMLDQVNHVAQELDLPCKRPILMREVRTFVGRPLFLGEERPNFCGTVTTSNFFFSFGNGQCWSINRCNLFPNGRPYEFIDPIPYLADLARTPCKVTTNSAYALATNWLTRFKVKIPELEAKYKPAVYQLEWQVGVPTGIYYVRWGPDGIGTVARVTLLGTTGDLLELRVEHNNSLNHQPTLSVTNWEELMATPEKTLERRSSQSP